ncbi:hypothetical protein [Lichenicoccus roseus]|uniref:Uncharacterized protein n=1 Tax=Lichenicoccus roseus TaxID=2683649 RepID=A0A5R9J7D0_9PROT|nr:hypothetical protein [Lichenicoccus roseus]TLU71266.1 hypothetical protein FE263_17325 [Lichenicoccus roseus]
MSAASALPLGDAGFRPLALRNPGVGTVARREVREFMAEAAVETRRLMRRATGIPAETLTAAALKGGTGRDRAFGRIEQAMQVSPLAGTGTVRVWRLLLPRGFPLVRLDDQAGRASRGRDCIEVHGLAIGRLGRGLPRADMLTRADRPWNFAATDHALGRCVERGDGSGLRVAVRAAHDALQTLNADDVARVLAAGNWTVPAGASGAWLCEVHPTLEQGDTPEVGILFVANTFLSMDMLGDDQRRQVALFWRRAPDFLQGALALSVLRPAILPSQVLQ